MKYKLMPVVLVFLLAGPAARASFDTAMADYQEAKGLMSSKDNKKEAGKIIALLTRARNDIMAVKRTPEQDQKLVEVSQALYWQYKMKPFNVTIPKNLPPRVIKAVEVKEEDPKEGPGEGEQPVEQEPGTDVVIGKTPPKPGPAVAAKPEAAKPEAAKPAPPKPVEPRQEAFEVGSIPPSYALALDFRKKHPEDLRTQYILLGQSLEETDQQDLVANALDLMEQIRTQIKDRREMYQEQWMKDISILKFLVDKRMFSDAREKVVAYLKSSRGEKLDEEGKACFLEFATRILVLEQCQTRLLNYDFRQSIPLQDMVKGFQGSLIGVTPTQLTVVDKSSNQQVTFNWEVVELPGLASAAAATIDPSSPMDVFFKAMAYKVTRQFEKAYDVFGDLQRKHPEEKEISANLQDCELQYLEDKGAPLDNLIKKVRSFLDDGNREQAKKSLDDMRRQLNHPLLMVYNHQVQLIRRKHNL